MLETERSSDEALRQATYRRLYLGACMIEDSKKKLEACYIILLAGRLGLRTGEIQHVREGWIDWMRGEIAIPRHDPCGCMNCWVAAKQKASSDEDEFREEMSEVIEKQIGSDTDRDTDEIIDEMLPEDDELPPEVEDENDETDEDDRTAEDILYEERWQPKYERSARRIPFGHSERLTAVIMEYLQQYDYMEITQPTMNNRVERAAELAEGVDPKNITIRGLRATAATNYATYIRNPKAIQDLMGWTRIETGARYFRRAGGFTTDIVYTAFEKTQMKPVMFPEEPEAAYPLIADPRPYESEPIDPPTHGFEQRKSRAKKTNGNSRPLIHPRSQNPPDDIGYDPERHEILTHEDLESDIINDIDGKKVIEEPTLDEFITDHKRLLPDGSGELNSSRRYKSMDEYYAKAIPKNPDDIFSGGKENESPVKGAITTFVNGYLRIGINIGEKVRNYIQQRFSNGQRDTSIDRVERQYGRTASTSEHSKDVPLIYKVSFVFSILVVVFMMLVFIALRTNNYWNPFTGEWQLSGSMAAALLLMGYVCLKLLKRAN